ncbi:RidA family protein [Desmospora profundinema]|uniref:2-iminobutanoate/2-iminopropanoate deaminase n=1 Tax=Desmospora profundinema TaxID=1571184 RepID=A0ABU1IQN6_9BACL|nr:RidA family protein [Desmospora profundinema]MDR6227112.1 2-iminobutanoate/2-iminopropanoate deaminase [Desmospora profundinema]
MNTIKTEHAPQAIGPYNQAVEVDQWIFTSGQIPLTPEGDLVKGDIEAETRQVLKNLSAVLEAAGSDREHVVKTTIFLTDMNDFQAVNHVYGSFFESHLPARSCVQVAALPKGARVEMEAIAVKK